ncbi:MAG: transposase [Candidatus Brocadiae bacterium]|nr:transposase [Candidatus Brocadiia bacterium]
MHRKTRKRFDGFGDARELTFSCHERRAFLSADRTREYFCDAVLAACERYPFELWAYVIMPEHIHMIIWPTVPGRVVSRVLQAIKQSVARRAIAFLRKHNPAGLEQLATGYAGKPLRFWLPGGGYDRNIMKRGTLLKAVDYIHNNPVRRGLVEAPGMWRWSSVHEWDEPGSGPIPIDLASFPVT